MADVYTISVKAAGPLIVSGPLLIVDPQGGEWELEEGKSVGLCRCGQSLALPPTDDVRQALHFLVLRELACQRREQSGRLVELVGADRSANRSHTLRKPGDTFSLGPLHGFRLLLG